MHGTVRSRQGNLCDASPIGIAAVLVQKLGGDEKPVYFASPKLDKTQKRYSQLHREALTIMFELDRFYKFIFGRKFTIVTYSQAAKEMFKEKNCGPAVTSARMQRWGAKLAGFEYVVIDRGSSKMAVPDALSRLPMDQHFQENEEAIENELAINMISELPTTHEEIRQENLKDRVLVEVMKLCRTGKQTFIQKFIDPEVFKYIRLYKELALVEGVLYYRDRVIIPNCLRMKLLGHLHSNHDGMVLMKRAARTPVFYRCSGRE